MPTFTAPPIPPIVPARLAQLAERLHRKLDGGTPRPDSKYQRRELALHVVSAYEAQQNEVNVRNAQALQTDFVTRTKLEKEWYFDDLKALAAGEGSVDEFLVPFVTATFTDSYDRDYLLVPQDLLDVLQERYTNLPGQGIFDIMPLNRKERLENPFVPTKGAVSSMLAGLFKGGLDGRYRWARVGDRVYLDWEPGQVRPATRWPVLEVTCIIRRRKTDELPAPALLQAAQDFDILARAEKLALKLAIEDKVIDNNAIPA